MGTLLTIEPQPRRRAVEIAKRGACGTVLHGTALDPRRARRVQLLLIVIDAEGRTKGASLDREAPRVSGGLRH